MLGRYENFPKGVHRIESFTPALSSMKLQQRLVQVLRTVNCKTFTFEEIGNPTIPGCTVIFELGIADANSFSYIDEEEAKEVLTALKKESFRVMDLFCVIRYYKDYLSNKKPLKFDYYMTRFVFSEGLLELRVFHERGPRYVSPKDIVTFLLDRINETSARKILKKTESQDSIN